MLEKWNWRTPTRITLISAGMERRYIFALNFFRHILIVAARITLIPKTQFRGWFWSNPGSKPVRLRGGSDSEKITIGGFRRLTLTFADFPENTAKTQSWLKLRGFSTVLQWRRYVTFPWPFGWFDVHLFCSAASSQRGILDDLPCVQIFWVSPGLPDEP